MAYITQLNKQSIAAAKLASAVDISLSGDATGTVSFDGSAAATIAVTLSNNATARSDLGLGTVATLDTGTSSGNVPVLDSDGKLDATVIPAIAITDVYTKLDITGTTEADARTALHTWVASLSAQKGDIVIYAMSWTSPSAGSESGTYIKTGEGSTISDWTEIVSPTSAAINALTARLNAHIGKGGVANHPVATTTEAGFLPTLSNVATNVLTGDGNWTDHVGLGGSVHATATTTDAGFMPALDSTATAANKFLNGSGAWIEHVGAKGTAVHAVADTTDAGFLPALPSEGASKYLAGDGTWADISSISSQTIIATTGATTGAFTLVGSHIGIAKSATEVYSAGVITYGTGLSVGQAVFVEQTTKSVVYGDLSSAAAGTYNQIGHVVSATSIYIAPVQPVYTIVA